MKASYYLNKRHILTFVIFSPFQISILVSSLIDGNIGSFIFNLALLALSLYSGLVIISYRYRFMFYEWLGVYLFICSNAVISLLYSGSLSLTPVTMWSQSRWTCLATGTRRWLSWDPGPAQRGIPKCEWFFVLCIIILLIRLNFTICRTI